MIRIFKFLFFKAANIVGQYVRARSAIVFEKHACAEEKLVFPYSNTPFQTIEDFYQQLFMEVPVITSCSPVIC